MSFFIALGIVVIVGILVANYYPKPNSKSPLAQGEILIPEVEEPVQTLVEAPTVPQVEAQPEAPAEVPVEAPAPKMSAKPKKKYYYNNKKPKTNK